MDPVVRREEGTSDGGSAFKGNSRLGPCALARRQAVEDKAKWEEMALDAKERRLAEEQKEEGDGDGNCEEGN